MHKIEKAGLNPRAVIICMTLLLFCALLTARNPEAADLRPNEILTVLPKDAIPAILSPTFEKGQGASSWMSDTIFVVGVAINGDSRAYPVPILSRHEIVNDVVGGIPIAVTW